MVGEAPYAISAFGRMRAFRIVFADALPLEISALNRSRSPMYSNLIPTTIGLKLLPDGRLEMIIADDSSSHAVLPFYLPVKIDGEVALATDIRETRVSSLVIDLRRGSVFWTSAYANILHSGSVSLLHCVDGVVPRDYI